MNPAQTPNKTSVKRLAALCAVLLLVLLLFGLKPKDMPLTNNVQWLADRPGLRFGLFGMAYSDNLKWTPGTQGTQGLTIEIALQSDSISGDRFKSILLLHSGLDAFQLMIGQWRSMMIVMNGDDYNGRQGTKKITIKDALLPQQVHLVALTSGNEGTRIFLDGKQVDHKRNLRLTIPAGPDKTRLVVGNSVYGKQSWCGEIYGIAIFTHSLAQADVERHHALWLLNQNLNFINPAEPQWLYTLDEKSGRRAFDHSGKNNALQIPANHHFLKKEMLVRPRYRDMSYRSAAIDIVLNFFGFIPMGMALNALLAQMGGRARQYGGLTTVTLCMLLSLTIEIVQAWIPSRSSDMADLILNTLGAGFGAGLFKMARHGFSKRSGA